MNVKTPHFVLFSESQSSSRRASHAEHESSNTRGSGCWHFVLKTEDGSTRLDVSDNETDASAERLELLALVRGLEALDEPSRVTLVTSSGVIRRGLRYGLDAWRESQWQWERFGRMTPIKNADLWRRVDQALQFHEVDCRMIRFDPPADDLSRPVPKWLLAPEGGSRTHPTSTAESAQRRNRSCHRRAASPHLWQALAWVARRLFGWCGLYRTDPHLVIATH